MKLILYFKISNSCGFAFVTGPEHVLNKLVKLNGIDFQEIILVIDEAKKEVPKPSLSPFPVSFSQKPQSQTGFNSTGST